MKKITAFCAVLCIILSGCLAKDNTDVSIEISSTTSHELSTQHNETTIYPELVERPMNNELLLQESDNVNMQDLFFLMEQLEKNHPAFDKDKYLSSVSEVANDVPQMDATQFYFAVRHILADMGDAHTTAYAVDQKTDRMVPIWQIKHYSDGWYINGIHESSGDYVGFEIVEINGMQIDNIVEMARPYISHETDARVDSVFAEEIKNSAFLKYFGIIEDDTVIPMTLRNTDGVLVQAEIQTYAIDDYAQYQSGVWIPQSQTGQNSGPNYYSKPLNDDVLFIQYAYCYEREDCSVDEWIKLLMADLDENLYSSIIFDLRFNTGGMFSLFQSAADAIGNYALEHDMKLYCLIAEDTFSTGLMHAVQMKEYGATLVGRPTGGKVNFYADTVTFELPNSGLAISCSTRLNETMPSYTGIALEPDITVTNHYADIISGIDKDVQTVLEIQQGNP